MANDVVRKLVAWSERVEDGTKTKLLLGCTAFVLGTEYMSYAVK